MKQADQELRVGFTGLRTGSWVYLGWDGVSQNSISVKEPGGP